MRSELCAIVCLAACVLPVVVSLAASGGDAPSAPTGLTVEFLRDIAPAIILDTTPELGWVVPTIDDGDVQSAYRILVASDKADLAREQGDLWDSGKVASTDSANVTYKGKPLAAGKTYYWAVRTWSRTGKPSAWSAVMAFTMGKLDGYQTSRYPLARTTVAPSAVTKLGDSHYLIDFGKVAFGYLQLTLDAPADSELTVHFGERGGPDGVNRKPGGTVRYYRVDQPLKAGPHEYEIHAPRDGRNTGGRAVQIPKTIGVIEPFRYVELENCPVKLTAKMARQVFVHYPFDDDASAFHSSSEALNDVWDLCKYTMKATSFAGVFVDGDRERIPYEADAYINQLGYYAADRDYSIARHTHEYLLTHPTWPTEWKEHSVLMAWADYMYTGDTESLARSYDVLKAEKTLEQRARKSDGLLDTKGLRDIVDWPGGERDGYDFKPVNTVVNAFYFQCLKDMADLAAALGKRDDAAEYRDKARNFQAAFNKVLFDAKRGVYVDGEGSTHASLHANMFPLAFGLVPAERRKSVADFVVARGMKCSVYAAQYLLEGLYEAGRADAALKLMTSKDVRSWRNMIRVGSTITLEAWDNRFKPNQDWNHAWGAAPINIVARYLLGVRPLEPGFAKAIIAPEPGGLAEASATVPTLRGPIEVSFDNRPGQPFKLSVTIPANMTATVSIPAGHGKPAKLWLDGKPVTPKVEAGRLVIETVGPGTHNVTRP